MKEQSEVALTLTTYLSHDGSVRKWEQRLKPVGICGFLEDEDDSFFLFDPKTINLAMSLEDRTRICGKIRGGLVARVLRKLNANKLSHVLFVFLFFLSKDVQMHL